LSAVAAKEFINNCVIDAYCSHILTTEDLNCLIKQIHCENQGADLLIPFMSQQYIHAVHVIQTMYLSECMKAFLKKSLEVAKEELDFLREDRQAVLVKDIVQQCEIYKELYCEKETDARLK